MHALAGPKKTEILSQLTDACASAGVKLVLHPKPKKEDGAAQVEALLAACRASADSPVVGTLPKVGVGRTLGGCGGGFARHAGGVLSCARGGAAAGRQPLSRRAAACNTSAGASRTLRQPASNTAGEADGRGARGLAVRPCRLWAAHRGRRHRPGDPAVCKGGGRGSAVAVCSAATQPLMHAGAGEVAHLPAARRRAGCPASPVGCARVVRHQRHLAAPSPCCLTTQDDEEAKNVKKAAYLVSNALLKFAVPQLEGGWAGAGRGRGGRGGSQGRIGAVHRPASPHPWAAASRHDALLAAPAAPAPALTPARLLCVQPSSTRRRRCGTASWRTKLRRSFQTPPRWTSSSRWASLVCIALLLRCRLCAACFDLPRLTCRRLCAACCSVPHACPPRARCF